MDIARSFLIFLISVDWLVVMTGIFGNILVIIAIVKYKCTKSPVTRILFINLASTDLGVLVVRHTFDSIQLYLQGKWIFGPIPCKLIAPVSRSFLTVSIVTLVAISYHRYTVIACVLERQPEQSVKRYGLIVAGTWLTFLAVYGAMDIPFRMLDESTGRCIDTLSAVKFSATVISEKGFYVLCLVSIFYMFTKMKKALMNSARVQQNSNIKEKISQSAKTLKLLKPTVIVLCITLFPAWLLHLIAIVIKRDDLAPSMRYLLYHSIGLLMVINSSANPFIYAMASRSFKNSFTRMLCRHKF